MALTGTKYDGDSLELDWGGTPIEQELLREVVISRKREMYDKSGSGERARRRHRGKREYSMRVMLWGTTRDADLQTRFDETLTSPTGFVVYPNGRTGAVRVGFAWVDSVEETISDEGMLGVVVNATVDGALVDVDVLALTPAQWFDFSQLSTLFQDSARTTAVAANNDPVGGVTDKSGNGYHASQSTANAKPLYKTAVQNGRAAILFDGLNDYLSHALVVSSNAQTVFAVVSANSQTGTREIYNTQANRVMMLARNATSPNWGTYGSAERPAGTNIQGAGWKILCMQRPSVGSGNFYTDGVLDGTFADSLGGSQNIGGALGYSRNFGGYVGEIIAFNSTLADADVAAIHEYLEAKWNINFP